MKDNQGRTKQIDRFIETARSIGTDEDESAFKSKLATIARQKPKDEAAVKISKRGQKKATG